MDLSQLKISKEEKIFDSKSDYVQFAPSLEIESCDQLIDNAVSLETEIPEALYKGMKEFICSNPQWDQYTLLSSALANFLFQNGSDDRAVVEKYLDDLFSLSDA